MEEIQKRLSEQQQSAKFTQEIKEVRIKEGMKAKFEATFAGNPKPEITWYFNNEPLKNSKNIQIKVKEIRTILTLIECNNEMAGYYTCKARNPLGGDSTRASLTVNKGVGGTEGEPSPIKRVESTASTAEAEEKLALKQKKKEEKKQKLEEVKAKAQKELKAEKTSAVSLKKTATTASSTKSLIKKEEDNSKINFSRVQLKKSAPIDKPAQPPRPEPEIPNSSLNKIALPQLKSTAKLVSQSQQSKSLQQKSLEQGVEPLDALRGFDIKKDTISPKDVKKTIEKKSVVRRKNSEVKTEIKSKNKPVSDIEITQDVSQHNEIVDTEKDQKEVNIGRTDDIRSDPTGKTEKRILETVKKTELMEVSITEKEAEPKKTQIKESVKSQKEPEPKKIELKEPSKPQKDSEPKKSGMKEPSKPQKDSEPKKTEMKELSKPQKEAEPKQTELKELSQPKKKRGRIQDNPIKRAIKNLKKRLNPRKLN
ncbi:unnamed protein product [Lepeophtheirus salmonis]|uniref:(salmon louse) hypothetical protein n=1 Tax=Lepeophtheirus salmonis TaxID=72036 RepID=A0A7R8D165_LEPSM|nr:unnamed protein product [Lepeophtheirus salmonis]CAF2991841.1 unnamed protein product [Lepeophtheirus salmonis]